MENANAINILIIMMFINQLTSSDFSSRIMYVSFMLLIILCKIQFGLYIHMYIYIYVYVHICIHKFDARV